jgi:hypothetical protein
VDFGALVFFVPTNQLENQCMDLQRKGRKKDDIHTHTQRKEERRYLLPKRR